jgi:hypothetical protein
MLLLHNTAIDDLGQLSQINWLAHIIIRPGFQRPLAICHHRQSVKRDAVSFGLKILDISH